MAETDASTEEAGEGGDVCVWAGTPLSLDRKAAADATACSMLSPVVKGEVAALQRIYLRGKLKG
jgi:hypothetical protein